MLRTENVNLLSVDLGYDSTKMMSKKQKIVFPSLAEIEEEGVIRERSFQMVTEDEISTQFNPKKLIIKIQSHLLKGLTDTSYVAYRVGDYVLNQKSSSIAYSLSDRKYEEPEEYAKLLAGICLLYPKSDKIIIKHLVTGLPIKYFENHKESFKNRLENNFTVEIKNINNQFVKKEIIINKATILPQGLASYYDFIMDDEGQVTRKIDSGFGLVDIGGLTIDCIAFHNGELLKDSPISFNDGVRNRIFKNIQDSIDIDISQDIIKQKILEDEYYIQVRNERYEFETIMKMAIDKLAKDIALHVRNRWENYLMISKILITGGASVMLFDAIDSYLPGFPCERINENPQFSNCRGYLKFGQALERKNKEELKSKIKERKIKNIDEARKQAAATKEV